ncbi:MAG TPA: four helix bundle protein [Phycisphaerales bacterium]|nr:four helix bundle protein [Phycisphaerales bacterium]
MAKVKTFRDLIAWQKGKALAVMVYRETGQMPQSEQFGLTMQMRRSAISVPSNIAEGFGRESRPDLLKFLRTARGSLNELETQHAVAIELSMLSAQAQMIDLIHETDRVLQGLINSLKRKT